MDHDINTTDNRPDIGVILPGGGARGAYQVGVLKAIAEISGTKQSPFTVITGTSVGAINAMALASHTENFTTGVRRMVRLWSNLHAGKVYNTNYWSVMRAVLRWLAAPVMTGLGRNTPVALLDNSPLEELLQNELDFKAVRQAIDNRSLRAVGISASSYRRGSAITFFEGCEDIKDWERSLRSGQRTHISVGHLMASTALPFMFRARKIDNEYFGDGSLRLNAPLSPAIRLGAEKLLVIGVRDQIKAGPPAPGEDVEHPSLGNIAGYMLDIAFSDFLESDVERFCRINETLSLMGEKQRKHTDLRKIDILTLHPSQDLRDIAARHAHELPRPIRALIKGLDAWSGDWRLPSYLLFEPGYIKDLIELGYKDAMARSDEIASFLRV